MKENEQQAEEEEELEQAKRKPRKLNYTFKKASKKRGIWQGEDDEDNDT